MFPAHNNKFNEMTSSVIRITSLTIALLAAVQAIPIETPGYGSRARASVQVSRKRATDLHDMNVRVEGLDQVFQLELTKMESPFAKRFTIATTDGNKVEHHIQDRATLPTVYTDKSGASTLAIREHDNGNYAIQGILNDKYAIEHSYQGFGSRDLRDTSEHYIYLLKGTDDVYCEGGVLPDYGDNHLSSYGSDDDDDDDEEYNLEYGDPTAEELLLADWMGQLQKKTVPSKLYVDIGIVMDYKSWELCEKNIDIANSYLAIFYTEVDKIYKLIETSKYILKITGIVFSNSSASDPIQDWNKASTTVLSEFGKWAYNHINIRSDFTILHTMSDIRGKASGGGLTNSTNGVAYISQACVVNHNKQTDYHVGIIEDETRSYTGIRTSAHEMGHSLGCTHDGDPPVSTPKGQPSAKSCRAQDGYIMSYFPHDENAFRFSPCSLEQMLWYSNIKNSKCIQKDSQEKSVIMFDENVKNLPGRNISTLQQCKLQYGSTAVAYHTVPDPQVCTQLWCQIEANGNPKFRGPALDGTPCGTDLMCNLGKCVTESEIQQR